ncbi:ead/Ea22-like family protein [Enterobacter kobei]|nr:ead/Ea22-like family protein [Enterobacter kobei]
MSNIDKQALRDIAAAAESAPLWHAVGVFGEVVDPDKPEWKPVHDFCKTFTAERVLALLGELEAKDKRIAELTGENEYIRKRFKEADLLFGKNLLVMQAAIIEWQGTGDARKGLAWIYNTLWGPGELPDEAEKDAQAYFDRKYAPLDEELMALHRWFWEQSEAERAAAAAPQQEV